MTNPPNRESTSVSLLVRIRAGEDVAWHRLVEIYSPLVYANCRSAGIDPDAAGDVMQEVFQAVHKSIAAFRRDRPQDSFRKWLKSIVWNKSRDHFRRRNKQPRATGGSTAHAVIQSVAEEFEESNELNDESEIRLIVRRAAELIRAEFEPKTWQAFWKTVIEDQPGAEVAEELGMSTGAVRNAKYKVHNRLRTELAELLD